MKRSNVHSPENLVFVHSDANFRNKEDATAVLSR